MEIKKRNRAELKSYFVKNAIPTETNFADLMDAVLIQKSDGVAKLPGDPLSIEAVGDDTSRKSALNFYRSFTQPAPSWRLELNPWGSLNDPASAAAGLSISDGTSVSRLFVSATNGNVGLGLVVPATPLHVRGAGAVATLESTTTESSLRIQSSEGANNRVEIFNRSGGRLAFSTAAGSDALNIVRDGKIGVRTDKPERALHLAGSGELALGAVASGVQTDSKAGLYWFTSDEYSIRRSAGAWSAPDYQQLMIQWSTGIVLTPGLGPDTGYGRSFVEIRGGKGLRVTDGGVVIGPGEPAGSKLKVAASATDFVSTTFTGTGMGELRTAGWANGYSVSALSKHLYLNRDSPATSNLYLGRNGNELQVLANGNVGVGTDPGNSRFKVGINATDFISMSSDNPNEGELRIVGWNSGWNINAMTKNLYLNRDAGASSNVYIGRANAELQVLANGNVGVGGSPNAKLHVFGDTSIDGGLRATGGVRVDGNLDAHPPGDGSFYRFKGQVYITVDDNLYFRDANSGDIKFWFDTSNGLLRQDDWTPAALQNGWANYQSGYNDAAFYKDRQGVVHLRGLVRSGAVGDTTVFTLPPGYRPPNRELRCVQTNNNSVGRVDISADGRVIPLSANAGWLSLDGISFRV